MAQVEKHGSQAAAKREARDLFNAGFKIQNKQVARTVADFSREELDG